MRRATRSASRSRTSARKSSSKVRIEFDARGPRILPKPLREDPLPSQQVYRPILCPFCGAGRPRFLRSVRETRYYACRCCNMNGEPSFKVPVLPGDPALEGLRRD